MRPVDRRRCLSIGGDAEKSQRRGAKC